MADTTPLLVLQLQRLMLIGLASSDEHLLRILMTWLEPAAPGLLQVLLIRPSASERARYRNRAPQMLHCRQTTAAHPDPHRLASHARRRYDACPYDWSAEQVESPARSFSPPESEAMQLQ